AVQNPDFASWRRFSRFVDCSCLEIVAYVERVHPDWWSARAQFERFDVGYSARPPGGDYRIERFGEILFGLRHDLRGGAAQVRRVALGLRAPVPGPDAKARRRLH